MICPNCGREIPDGTVCPCTLAPPALSDNPALNVVKTVGSSPLFLAMTILFSISALLTILSSLGNSDTFANIYYYAYNMGLDMDTVMAMLDAMQSAAVASVVISSIPAILLAVAMWIHFGTCKNLQSGNISTAGLTICKVLRYIYMIFLCLVAFTLLAVLALAIIGIATSSFVFPSYGGYGVGYSDEEARLAVIIVLGVTVLIVGAIMTLTITYQASIIRTINRTKQVAQSGMADDRVSGYFIGMNYFVAVCSIISGLIALFTAPIAGAATLANGVAFILMSQLLRRYRQEMNLVLFPPVQPAAPYAYTQFNSIPQAQPHVENPQQPGPPQQ